MFIETLSLFQATLAQQYKVQGIPTLIFVKGKQGDLVTADGREKVMAGKDSEIFGK